MPIKPGPGGAFAEKPYALVICECVPLEASENAERRDYAEALCDALSEYFSVPAPVRCGRSIWKHIINGMPDAIVISRSLPDVDAISFVKSLRRMTGSIDVAFFICCPKTDESIRRICDVERIAGLITFGEPAEQSAKTIYDSCISFRAERSKDSLQSIREYLDSIFNFTDSRLAQCIQAGLAETVLEPLGLDPGLKGTKYLETIISMLLIGAPERLDELYSYIGDLYKTSGPAVEKAIRYSIERAWEKGSPYLQYALFGNSVDEERGKPTNKEFIMTAAQHMHDKLRGRI